MRYLAFLLAAAASAAPAVPRPAPAPPPAATPRQIANEVRQERLRALVERLVSFGTRHTLSSQTDPKRGIGAALNWTADEFGRYSKACGDCLTVVRPSDVVSGRRVPTPTRVTDVLAIQRGSVDPNRVVIISGHIDSRVTDVMNATADAPGANDDGSGTAAVIEAARVLSRHKFPYTIVYAALMGEEQGLLGGKVLADYAKAQGWEVIAQLNNDIIGNSCGSDGVCDDAHVRVISEGPRWQGHEDLAARQRSLGGENDAPSRNISRWMDGLAADLGLGLDVRQIWRSDRYGRGGDHLPLLDAGYPAVRLTVAIENYNWQHQDLRTENGVQYGDTIDKMDFPYLTKVVKLNVAALAALARAPQPPEPAVEGAVSTDTTLAWTPVKGAVAYVVRWRPTDATNWTRSLRLDEWVVVTDCRVPGDSVCARRVGKVVATLPHVRVDDWVFGVSSVSADGYESPVASAVPGGAFRPYAPPPPAQP
ncbi:MAG: M20/M25/M40 family metallo-hydrolase [Alphaproteobacteria bacterium]|nr:M20/M25/M40 family metallo-hydrolase [Alphaproteobacteria bacterium]MBV9371413.1 M20/M25/M40 family metallo-hydrolase [Alphaproteobacteria bacterium]MBV9902350.1 M20/M25/M40 family metallo-hydrolase [Alphaproteobacteria bacterium]